MSDKYLKEIAKELRLIRIELQKSNKAPLFQIDGGELTDAIPTTYDEIKAKAGERVTIK